MKIRVQSRARSKEVDRSTEQVKTKIIKINEVLEFDHIPSGDEIQAAIADLPKYKSCDMQFLETLAIKMLPD